jgi:predicted O-methyltransferase YrrM
MDIILQDYNSNKVFYENLKKIINENINGRVCHNRVIILYILCKIYDIKTYVEIGVHNGASMSYVVSNDKNIKKCIGIDLFENTFGHYIKDKITQQKTSSNIEKNNKNNQLFLIKGNSNDNKTKIKLVEKLNNNKIDLLFIDGDHSYEGVKNDFINYENFVNINGFIVLDDYCKKYPGILKFVDEYIKKNNKYEIIGVFEDNELIIKKINV